MVSFTIFLIFVLCGIASFTNQKGQCALSIASVILLSLVMGLSYDSADYGNYLHRYYNGLDATVHPLLSDPGYLFLNNIFNIIGFTFEEYRYFLTLLLIIFIFGTWYKIYGETYTLFPLYIIYPMIFDIIQYRNFIIEIIIFCGFYIYARKDNNLHGFMLCVIFACLFHKAAIFFLLIYCIDKMMKSRCGRKALLLFMLIGVLMPLYAESVKDMSMDVYLGLANIENIGHYKDYLMDDFKTRHYTSWAVTIIYLIIIYRIRKDIMKKRIVDKFYARYSEMMYDTIILMCILLPIFPLLQDLDRLLRILTLPLYTIMIWYVKERSILINKIFGWCCVLVFAMMVGYVKLYHGLPEVVPVIFEKNYWYELFL